MSSPVWPRRHYRGVGGRPHLWYKVHGTFTGTPRVSASAHRTSGPPEGIDLLRYDRDQAPEVLAFGLDGLFGESLAALGPVASQVRTAPHALVLRGEIDDRPSLDYLRDVVGLITALLDGGGVAVFDPLILRWWTPDAWRRELFEPDAPVPGRHAVILVSDEERPGRRWFHTRGMQKFGRPDISLRDVAPEHEAGALDACERFIDLLAQGALVPHAKPVRLRGLPDGLLCFHEGSADDPDFNNVHLELRPPRAADVMADPGDLDLQSLLDAWRWLELGEPAVLGATLLGDLVLEDASGAIHLLDTTTGQVRRLAASREVLDAAPSEVLNDWFAAALAFDCLESGLSPGPGQCLSYKIPPALGGSFDLENLEVTDLDVHHHVVAQILEQVRDLPDGTPIRMVTGSDTDGGA